MNLITYVLSRMLSGCAALLFVKLAEHSLPDGIPLKKNSDQQPPENHAEQKGTKPKDLKRNLHPCPRASAWHCYGQVTQQERNKGTFQGA